MTIFRYENTFLKRAVAVFAAAIVIGCDGNSATGPLRSRADDGQDARIDAIERLALDNTRKLVTSSEYGVLSSTDSGFTPIPFDLGYLTFKIEGVAENGSGTDVSLSVGNPTTATITRLAVDAVWFAKGEDDQKDPRGNLEAVILSGDFKPGQWATTKLSLQDIKPDEFGYLVVSDVTAKTISLGTAP